MAEIEMEVDMTRPLELDGHMDDDFIDFDTDMADQRDPTSLHAGLEQASEDLLGPEGVNLDKEPLEHYSEQEADAIMNEEVELVDAEDTMHDVDEIQNNANYGAEHGYYETEDHDQVSNQQIKEGDDEEEYVEISHEADETTHEADKEEVHQPDDEIDYELEEPAEQHESHEEIELEVGDGLRSTEAEGGIENPVTADTIQPVGEAATEEPAEAQGEPSQDKDTAEEDEITYEEDEDDQAEGHDAEEPEEPEEPEAPGGPLDQDAETEPGDSVEDVNHPQADNSRPKDKFVHDEDGEDIVEDSEEHVTTQNEGTENAEFDEYDVAADVTEGHNNDQDVDSEHVPSISGQNSAVASESEFPVITVHYKGDEFPLFSNTSDGFFTEISILDETMDKLLSGFREELANEICHEDELVFQVDELGLEFSESSRDSLSSVTLQQILEIFDLLVKNQDPDGTRTLYTYLFTKPCATKRLESLIESATAGKGLDEVTHLFESPVTAMTGALGDSVVEDGQAEHPDEYDTPADETDNADEKHDGQYSAEEGVDLNSSPLDDNQGEDAEEDAEEGEQAAINDYAEGDEMEPNVENVVQTQGEASEAVDVEEQDETNAYDESESNPFIHLELDNEEDENDAVDLEAHDADEQNQFNPDIVDVGAANTNTSTTTTLKDDDETGSIIVDIGVDVAASELGYAAEADHKDDEDDVGEIDWRDQPDEDEEAPRPASAAGKRARGDDDVDAEEEQDAKRRRP